MTINSQVIVWLADIAALNSYWGKVVTWELTLRKHIRTSNREMESWSVHSLRIY